MRPHRSSIVVAAPETSLLRILFLLHRFPYPPSAGGPCQALNLIKHLAQSHRCDILAFEHAVDEPAVDEFHRLVPNARVLGLFAQRPVRTRRLRDELQTWLPRVLIDVARALDYVWRFRWRPVVGGWPHREYWRPDFAAAVAAATGSGGYDVVHVETIMLAVYRPYCGNVTTVSSPYDALAAWTESRTPEVRGLSRAAWRTCASSLRAHERKAYARFTRVCVVSPLEQKRLLDVCATTPVEAVPISVDDAYFGDGKQRPPVQKTGARVLLLPASWLLTDPLAVGILLRFLREGLQRLRRHHDVEAHVSFGAAPAPILRMLREVPGVVAKGWVPDFRRALHEADVVVLTDHGDNGMKNRVVQAMAAARPIVATRGAVSGLTAEDGVHLWVRDSPDAMADAIDALLRDPQAADRAGAAARAFAQEHFSASAVGAKWERLYTNAMASRRN